jgi:hypothetical protein
MIPQQSLRRLAGASVLLTTLAVGQQPQLSQTSPPQHDPVVPIHTAADDEGHAYGIWGAGPGYKISFHDGATLVPYLGKAYAHNQPWTWRTTSVRLGGVELATQAPRLSYGGVLASYDLGGVTEAWELRPDGAEQTFVIDQRPAAGELVVQGVVQSMLQADAATAAHQPLSFRDGDGLELVRYGAAIAIDANGQQRAMTTSHRDGTITLRLDAAWLETAAFPLVVDPLVGPGTNVTGNTRYEVDVVRCAETSVEPNWVAYSVYASLGDADVYTRRWNDDGTIGSVPFTDVTSSWSTNDPAAAYNASANSAVFVFDRSFPSSSTRRIRAHRHLRSDYVSNTTYDVLPSTDNAWRSDVGGTRYNQAGDLVMVVYQQEPNNGGGFQSTSGTDVFAIPYNAATGAFGSPIGVGTAQFSDNERPSINQVSTSFGPTANWLVCYQSRNNLIIGPNPNNDDWDLSVREVDSNGGVNGFLTIDGGNGDHKFAPQIAGASGRYLVAYVTSPISASTPFGRIGHQIRTMRVDWPALSGAGVTPHPSRLLVSSPSATRELGSLAFDRNSYSHWALLDRNAGSGDLSMRLVGYTGRLLRSELVFNASSTQLGVLGGLSFDAFDDEFAIAYAYNQSGSDVTTIDRFQYPFVFSPSTAGTACSPASISWFGSQQIGSELSGVAVDGAAFDSIHIAALATAPASAVLFGVPPIQNGCWLLVANAGPDYLGLLDVRVGANASWALPLPEFLSADTYYVQGWHTVGGGNFDFVSTQRLAVPTIK